MTTTGSGGEMQVRFEVHNDMPVPVIRRETANQIIYYLSAGLDLESAAAMLTAIGGGGWLSGVVPKARAASTSEPTAVGLAP